MLIVKIAYDNIAEQLEAAPARDRLGATVTSNLASPVRGCMEPVNFF